MLYHIEIEERIAGGRGGLVYTLKRDDESALAEIWPAYGFNCLRWQVVSGGGTMLRDLLYADGLWTENAVPTRSGVPLLFPFPNRIRDGRFRSDGKEYQLPLNDSTKKNAIHGFAPRRPWRVTGQGTSSEEVWLRGEFRPSIDAVDAVPLWPSDYSLTTTIRLGRSHLRYEFVVANHGAERFPFGLGMHPYFRFPYAKVDEGIDLYRIWAPARSFWALDENLPTGELRLAEGDMDWNQPRFVGDTVLDAVYTELGNLGTPSAAPLVQRAEIRHGEYGGSIQVWCSPHFRESVMFTPAHRKAVCIEPYTCVTDAANLSARGIDAGWRVLDPGTSLSGVVEFRWDPYATEFFKVK